jgi:hypothetical protein
MHAVYSIFLFRILTLFINMKLNKNGVALGIICLVVGSLLGNQVPSILQSTREEDSDYNFLYNKILTIEDDIEILYSNLPKE